MGDEKEQMARININPVEGLQLAILDFHPLERRARININPVEGLQHDADGIVC